LEVVVHKTMGFRLSAQKIRGVVVSFILFLN